MKLFVDIIPAFQDNYLFFLEDKDTGTTAIVDPGAAEPVIDYLSKHQKKLDFILNTHHHWDHTKGNAKLKSLYNCIVIGPRAEKKIIPCLDQPIAQGDHFQLGSIFFDILDVPGHTLGHIAYYETKNHILFCGDTLFAMGCGRLFEGTADQMFKSLQKFSSMPDNTTIYCAHEYTLANGEFALTIDPKNTVLIQRVEQVKEIRKKGQPTIPTTLGLERKTNPFLRAKTAEEFARIRAQKDHF